MLCIGSLGKTGRAGTALATDQEINSIVFDERVVNPRFDLYFGQTLSNG
jgi:type I restriction enzyme, S subunit